MATAAEKKKCFRKRRPVEAEEADAGAESGDEAERRLALEEVKFLQKKRERRSGIPALPAAEPSVAGAGDQNRGGLKKVGAGGGGGGGGGGDGEKEDLVLQDTFAQETAVTIEDPNMMKYVEQELAKQTGRSIDGDKGDQVESELKCLEDELYAVPEHLKVKRRNPEESSTQWTTGIAEVQLPIEYKLRNIEETEAAKKLLQEKRLAGKTKSELNIPSSYSADYFHRGRDYAEKLRRDVLITSSHTIEHEAWREGASEIAEVALGATEGASGGAEEALVAAEEASEMALGAFGSTEGASERAEEAFVTLEAASEMAKEAQGATEGASEVAQEAFIAPEVASEMVKEAQGATESASEVAQEAFIAPEVASRMTKETFEGAEGTLVITEEVPVAMEKASEMAQEASGEVSSDIFHMEVDGFPPHGVEWPAGLQFAAAAHMHGVMSHLLTALEEFFTRTPLPSIEEARTFMENTTRGWHTCGFPQDVWMAKMNSLWDEFGRQHLSEMLKR